MRANNQALQWVVACRHGQQRLCSLALSLRVDGALGALEAARKPRDHGWHATRLGDGNLIR